MCTRRSWRTDSTRSAPIPKLVRRSSTPESRCTVWRWSSTSAVSGVSQSPPAVLKRSGSQLGRLTMSSFSTSRPATAEVSRL